MGYAIKRANGTYRAWSRNDAIDPTRLRAGESLVALDEPPEITYDAPDGGGGERPDALRAEIASIFTGPPAQKRARWGDVLEAYPPALGLLILLRAPMNQTAREIASRIKARIGQPNQVLTQSEYDALAALAASHNLRGVIP